MIYIYGLIDPRNGNIEYVGQTVARNFKARMRRHTNLNSKYNNGKKKLTWLTELKAENLTPGIWIIQECTTIEEADKAEVYWIDHYRSRGEAKGVTNRGGRGWEVSEELKQKFRETGRLHNPYVKDETDITRILNHFLKGNTVTEVSNLEGCSSSFLYSILKKETHKDLIAKVSDLHERTIQFCKDNNIPIGGRGGNGRIPSEDLPDELLYKAFNYYENENKRAEYDCRGNAKRAGWGAVIQGLSRFSRQYLRLD